MAFNNNQKIENYVSSDLQKQRVVVPPRNKKREIDLIIYSTNQTTDVIIKNTANLAVQAKLEKQLKLNPTTPVGGAALKPKFGNVGETEAYRTQINGFVYEEIPFDNTTYVFATQNLATANTIGDIQKFRVINYQPIFNNGKFLYAEVSLLPESLATIPSLQKLNWNLVQTFQADVKTKYLKIELDSKAALFANGLKISVLPEKTQRPVNDGYTINSISNNLVLKFIKVRQTNPIEIDDLTLSDLNDRTITVKSGQLSSSRPSFVGYLGGKDEQGPAFQSYQTSITQTEAKVFPNYILTRGDAVQIPTQLDYFSKGLKFIKENGEASPAILKENLLANNDVKAFLNGTYSIDSFLIEKTDKLNINSSLQKLADLNKDNAQDRLYFVITQQSNLLNYLESAENNRIIRKRTPFPKTRLISESEWGINFIDNDPIIIELELQAEGFNPKIELSSIIARNIKVTQYDVNHQIIGTPNLSFATESAFDDSQTTTTIQL